MKRVIVAILLVGTVVGLFNVFRHGRSSSEGSFPWLEQGAYVGTISGFRPNEPESSAVLYVERLTHGNVVLVVPMIEGQDPELVSVRQRTDGDEKVLEPIGFRMLNKPVKLVGRTRFGRLSGEIQSTDNQSAGRWELRKTSTEELVAGSVDAKGSESEIDRWLTAKSKYLEIDHSYSRVMALLIDAQEKSNKLQTLLAKQELLRERADTRKISLKKEIEAIGSEQHSKEETLQNLLAELDLQNRITKRGKIISLARKVANRENAWYLANWRTADDSAGLEEFLLGGEAVDLAAVEKQLVKAREKETLLRELNNERRKIAELQARLRESTGRDATPATTPIEPAERLPTKKAPEQKRSLWDRIFG